MKPGDELPRRLAARQNASQDAGRIRLRLYGDGPRVLAVVQDAGSRLPAWPDWGESGEARLALSAGQLAVHWGWLSGPERKALLVPAAPGCRIVITEEVGMGEAEKHAGKLARSTGGPARS